MERKIGEIFEYEDNWYQCVKDSMYDYCRGCAWFKNLTCTTFYGNRDCSLKATCKKLEPVGDPYPLYGHIVQRYAGVKFPVALTEKRFINCNEINNTIDIEVKQQNPNTEDMEAKEKTMPVPDGWEFDRIDESGNIVLKEKKKELPETWEECLKVVDKTEYITNDCEIYDGSIEKLIKIFGGIADTDRNLLPRGLGKPMLALCQLLVCRNAWWQQLGWKPDWRSPEEKYCIYHSSDGVDWKNYTYDCRILAFPTAEVRDQFLESFRDLIEEAKELL